MAGKKKLPTGITQNAQGEYCVRPYDRKLKKKGPQRAFATLSEAVAFKEKVAAGKVDPSARIWTVDEWVEHWTTDEAYKRRKESTNLHNAERVRQFAKDFEGMELAAVTRQAARAWANKHPARVPAVRTMLEDAVLDGVLDANPFKQLRLQSRGPGRKFIKPMTEGEVKLLAQCAYDKWPDWNVIGNLIQFGAYSGLRRGEVLALRWTDIDWEKGTILVERQWLQKPRTYGPPKNGQTRLVPLLEPAAQVLRHTDKHQSPDGELVWYSTRGKRIEPALLDYYWRQVRERFHGKISDARIKEIDLEWHTLRHFYISWLVDKGVPVYDIAGAVGHTDGGRLIQDLYGHLYPDNSIARIQAAVAA